MPTYEYECDKCRRVFEVRQRISEPALTTCDECGGAVRRLLSPAPFILKGDGWYVTDYPSASRKKAREAEKQATSTTPEKSAESKTSSPAPSTEKTSTTSPAGSSS
ncbi:MAG: zinc ribbon domain-containing protein [Candidatus Rokubacteria bacterium]|nr:zinc ribbon domain-containing protein [Candidatus Rokubacteria bacterium]